ncbi:YeaC family protein [Aliidiomarina sanyensis]|uniref:DUF1315 domain-containing protein n=1 Tax=Aliidiomarina sanyensis TaxID=1249555 RepID=A0A432WRS3_9GAMM|nr:DUF1315 family protein [Aliidiomarina sanyensis]RUO36474.1 DUF1315 domain-containing protein [Aliidiomarina sanyensis]
MQYDDVLRAVSPEIYERMKEAVETGRWPDGNRLTPAQLENAMEIVMVYQARRLNQTDHFSINAAGDLVLKTKGDLRRELKARAERAGSNDIARFKLNSNSDSDSETH